MNNYFTLERTARLFDKLNLGLTPAAVVRYIDQRKLVAVSLPQTHVRGISRYPYGVDPASLKSFLKNKGYSEEELQELLATYKG